MAAATVAEEVVEDDVPLLAGACIAIYTCIARNIKSNADILMTT